MRKTAVTLSSILLLVSACGGSSNNSSSSAGSNAAVPDTPDIPLAAGKTGKLIDSAVQGVSYSTPSFSGKTNSQGEYNYNENETVTFSIGDITFPAVTAKGILTPLDLAGTSNLTDPTLINITRLLQSLDNDQNPENGIVIDSGITTVALNFNQNEIDFANEVQAQMALTLVESTAAIAHLQTQLDELNIGSTNTNEEAANVPAGLIGSHNFKYQLVNQGYNAADGDEQTFEVLSGDVLQLPDGTQLSNPVFVDGHKTEIIWKDTASSFVYALSNATTGSVHELNISNTTFGQSNFVFYGSFTPITANTGEIPSGLLSLAGTFTSAIEERTMRNVVKPGGARDVTLTIDGTTGVITVGDYYTIDPSSEHFSFNDDTNKSPMFSPRYEIFDQTPEGNSVKLILHRQIGQPLNSWITQDLTADLRLSANVTPIPQSHKDFVTDLMAMTPTTITITGQDDDYNSGLDEPVCTQFDLTINNSDADSPQLVLTEIGVSPPAVKAYPYGPTSAFYETVGDSQSLNFGVIKVDLDGGTITLSVHKLGLPSGDEVSNDPEKIPSNCL